MRIVVVGTGYVGLTTAVCLAEIGHEVTGVDIDAGKVRVIASGKSPFFEPGLEEMLKRNLKEGRIRFTTVLKEALPNVDVVFSAVATPRGKDHRADLTAVYAVVDEFGKHVRCDCVFVNKSTVPAGTGKACEERLQKILEERGARFRIPVISNPEFLREGEAVNDTLHPSRTVIGTADAHAREVLTELYKPIARTGRHPLLFVSRESAEIIKYASNTFLATKISFINMLSELCEKAGADVREVAEGMGLDDRIGPRFLHAGIGYGGSCFPKDIAALQQTGKEYGLQFPLIAATTEVNEHQRRRFFHRMLSTLPTAAIVAVWGLSFKPKTDDLRDAPSLELLRMLFGGKEASHGGARGESSRRGAWNGRGLSSGKGVTVRIFDPVSMERFKSEHTFNVVFCSSPLDAAHGADAVVLLTEWDEFRGIDLKKLAGVMRGNDLFDGRNVYDPEKVEAAGLRYHGIGIPERYTTHVLHSSRAKAHCPRSIRRG
jgi:UDPglucose 6-dehydrogenase